ncbi:hypothetical protein SAMN02745857_03669 [Andreprevotia lacus DSM 23236]|jgi:chitinase|uniref:Uncharacterized protein n=1 Tax=Andreprevotia lacus DSM 23236 TaxID=1121001 RepID=A0A1W1Y077_9NEIS|nr:hypothetical protein [Andreprevotia lacus]SMC29191.1 hypothetical protein SAMN02745857_03669 [Andreprevotia lacus DSM 23236]
MRSIMIWLGLLCAANAHADRLVFEENFERDLAQWVGQDGPDGRAIVTRITADPLRSGNKVAQPFDKTFGGDAFTRERFPAGRYLLEFDYLGRCQLDCGGVVGYSKQYPGRHTWIAGTDGEQFPVKLIDNGHWQHKRLTFASSYAFHLMFEQWVESRGELGSVYFDNFRLWQVSE